MKETLIYALSSEATEAWQEDLISTQCKTEADVVKVIAAAKADGWHSFRVAYYDGSAPNFSATVNL